MNVVEDSLEKLRNRLRSIEAEATALKDQITETEEAHSISPQSNPAQEDGVIEESSLQAEAWPLQPGEYARYGRQMIMPEIGLEGQLRLKKAKVLIVGIGGLGCPAARYLAGAGMGVLGLVDDDTVSLSNIHRQILYREDDVGRPKVLAAVNALKATNSTTTYQPHMTRLSPARALQLFEQYDLILDCTDHPSSRYFISDAAVLSGKPLITASGLRTEGQLMVLNHPSQDHSDNPKAFCYRCVFPKPPPPESVTTCGEGGILGPVVGVMGVLMAMEAIKVLTLPPVQTNAGHDSPPSLLLYSAYSTPLFRSVRLKGKRENCIACSSHASITRNTLESGSLDYIKFCGARPPTTLLAPDERINAKDYNILRQDTTQSHILIDVREPVEFDIAHIPASINLPFSFINRQPSESLTSLEHELQSTDVAEGGHLHFICRLGNDSQIAVQKLKDEIRSRERDLGFEIRGDVRGGLAAWKRDVDRGFPDYGD